MWGTYLADTSLGRSQTASLPTLPHFLLSHSSALCPFLLRLNFTNIKEQMDLFLIKEIKFKIKKVILSKRFEGLKVQGVVFLDRYRFQPAPPG